MRETCVHTLTKKTDTTGMHASSTYFKLKTILNKYHLNNGYTVQNNRKLPTVETKTVEGINGV